MSTVYPKLRSIRPFTTCAQTPRTDRCGNGGSIGIRYVSGGAYGMGAWNTRPNGACPDGTTSSLLGTSA